ncbi:hypothetical protein [Tamilnaduibacter salinus]|uniref:hypothetical protein n=1 Tax=Tamilnaduibacter salinus TaxID=1484056 RepID=UPI0013040B4A|nr:hypothetical protein [Tamilnaduibacter salinus]
MKLEKEADLIGMLYRFRGQSFGIAFEALGQGAVLWGIFSPQEELFFARVQIA